MIKIQLRNIPNKCPDFLSLNLEWEYIFNTTSKVTQKARERRRHRSIGNYPKMRRYVRIKRSGGNLAQIETLLLNCPDIERWEYENRDEPLYNPTDPDGLNYAWTKQTLTHATNTTAFDVEKGDDIVIGIIESSGAGADYTDAELGGTGNRTNDWAAIQAGTHAKFTNYTTPLGVSVDPYGTGHGNTTSRQAVSVIDNATAYCGSCPNGKVMMAVGQNFDEAIQRMADLGVDVISVSYTNCYSHRTAIQYAVAAGVIVVYAHGSNTHEELASPQAFESITVGGFSLSDVSERSYGEGLTVVSRGPSGSQESWSTAAIAGIIGLILADNPTWNIYDVWSALIYSCQQPAEMGGAEWHLEYGWGIPDAYSALQLASADLRPLAVIDFAVAASGIALQLSWLNLATTDFDHFEIRRKENTYPTDETDGTLVYSGSALSYDDILAVSGDWYYAIWGVDSDSDYSTNTDFVKAMLAYTAPIVTITNVIGTWTTITVQWDSLGASGYKVYWDTDSGAPYANSADAGDVTQHIIEGLTPGTAYYLTVTAYDDETNETDYATEETVLTTELDTPVIATITDTTNTVTMTWGTVGGVAGYKIFWDTNSGEPYANQLDIGNVLTYTLTGLSEGQQYYVTIQAYISETQVSELAVEVSTVTGSPSLNFVGATFEKGIAHFVMPAIADVDFAGVTIKNMTRNKIVTSGHVLSDYFDTQANIDDIYEIWAEDNSGNSSEVWNVIVNRHALTVSQKGV